MDNSRYITFANNLIKICDNLVTPINELKGNNDYYRVKSLNIFLFDGFFASFLYLIIALLTSLFHNPITDEKAIPIILIFIFVEITFLLMGKSTFYFLEFLLVPASTLLGIWSYFFQYEGQSNLTFSVFNPTTILVLGIIVSGIILSKFELLIYSILSIFDIFIMYSLLAYPLSQLLSSILILIYVTMFMIINSYFRILSYKYLNETNLKLTKEVEITQKDLLKERSILYALVANLQDGVIIIDFDFMPIIVNNNFINIFNEITKENFTIDKPIWNEENKANIFNFLTKAKFNLSISEVQEKNKKFYLFITHLIKIKLEKDTIAIMIEIHDITDLKALDVLEKNFRNLIMHELRTPFTTMQLSVGNLLNYYDKMKIEDRERILRALKTSTDKFGEIIKKISTLSNLEIVKEVKFANIDCKTFITDFKKLLITFEEPNNTFTILDQITRINIINIDKDLIFQAIENILDNSRKFSKEKIEIGINFSEVESKYFKIEIRDNGIGIDTSELPFIFNRFYKGKDAENIPGEGLGLSIVKEILHIHKGDVKIESEKGLWTSVNLYIPIVKHVIIKNVII